MPETDSVHELVNDDLVVDATATERDLLSTVCATHLRVTTSDVVFNIAYTSSTYP